MEPNQNSNQYEMQKLPSYILMQNINIWDPRHVTILSVLICSVALNSWTLPYSVLAELLDWRTDWGYRRYRILIIQSLLERESERLRLRKGMERSRETGSEGEGEREREGGRGTATVRFGEKTKTATEDLSLNKQFYMQFPQTYFHLL